MAADAVGVDGLDGRIRDVREGPDGLLYLALEGTDGSLSPVLRLEPVPGEIAPPGR